VIAWVVVAMVVVLVIAAIVSAWKRAPYNGRELVAVSQSWLMEHRGMSGHDR
jgi:hypothetical protein